MAITDILTPDYFRMMYLQGIRTTLAACGFGSAAAWSLPDEVITQHIVSAASYIGSSLDIDLRSNAKRQFVEKYDQMDWHGERWYLKSSKVRPVKRVYKLEVQRGVYASGATNDGYVEMPIEWVQIASQTQGSIFVTQYMGTPRGIAHLPWGSSLDTFYRWMPLFVRITQSSGFEFELVGTVAVTAFSGTGTISGTGHDDLQQTLQSGMRVKINGQVVTVLDTPTSDTFTFTPTAQADFSGTAIVLDYDPMILDAIAYRALIPILESIGSRLYGPVASKSVGIDSMSQSKTLAISAASGPFYSQQLRAQERIDSLLEELAVTYRAFNTFSF